MSLSRSPLEACIASFVLRGDFGAGKARAAGGPDSAAPRIWDLDEPLRIASQELQQLVASYLGLARRDATLSTIIETLHRCIGETQQSRPKGRLDPQTGKRPQLGTVRILPPRRQAIQSAWETGFITDEERASAIPEPADDADDGDKEP